MFMKKTLQLFILLFSNFLFSQYEMIDKKMDDIPKQFQNTTTTIANYITQNFTSEEDKIRAAFYWTASNISYDVANMYLPKIQTTDEKISSALKTKKGVCMHYAEVLNAIVNQMGMKAYVIDGYTKQFGKIARLSHSWNACKVNGKWYLLDPTWGAGYVNEDVFYKKLNNNYFKPTTADFLKTHMPFDYMWQLNEKPITNDDFYKDITESELIANPYDFNAAIVEFEALSVPDKMLKQIERIEKTGLKNNFIKEKHTALKKNFEGYKNNNSIPKLEQIVSEFNQANKLLNDFILYRNSRFTPMLSDEKIKEKVQIPYDKWLFCQQELARITDISKENLLNFNSLKKTVSFAQKRFDAQMNFVNDYLAKSPSERVSAFTMKRK
jgi:hypothetical protein